MNLLPFVPLLIIPTLLFSKTVDFTKLVTITLENNKKMQAQKLDIQKAKQTLKEVKGAEIGILKFNENITKTNHAGYVFGMKLGSREASFGDFGFNEFLAKMNTLPSGAPALLATQPNDLNSPEARTNFETKLTYELPVFTGWKLDSAKEMMSLQEKANEVKYKFDEKALALEVLKTYNGAVAAKAFIEATKKAKNATMSYVNFATELLNEGFVTKIDLKQAQVYDMDVNVKMTEAKNQFDLAIAYLRFLSNDSEINDVGPLVSYEFTTNQQANTLQETAINNRDDLAWMDYNKQTAKAKITYDSADKYPMIGLHMEYGFNDNQLDNFRSSKEYYLIAGGLEYKIFNGFATQIAEEKAKLDYQKAVYYHSYMQDGIKLEVEKNLLTLNAKKAILAEKTKALNLAEEVTLQTEEMYKNHLTNMTNLLIQQANLEKARAELILATYDESVAAANLKISLGQTLNTQEN